MKFFIVLALFVSCVRTLPWDPTETAALPPPDFLAATYYTYNATSSSSLGAKVNGFSRNTERIFDSISLGEVIAPNTRLMDVLVAPVAYDFNFGWYVPSFKP